MDYVWDGMLHAAVTWTLYIENLLLRARFVMTPAPGIKICAIAAYRLFHSHAQVLTFTDSTRWTGVYHPRAAQICPATSPQFNRGFSCDVISSQFCKSSFSQPPCWFLYAWPGIGKYNKMSRNFLFSSNHNAKLRLRNKHTKTHTRLKFWVLL